MLLAFTIMTPTFITILGILAAPIIGYIAAARKMSGKINTSEASDLWAESKSMREDYKARTAQLEKRVEHLEENNATLTKENIKLNRKISEDEILLEEMKIRIQICETENNKLKDLVDKLEKELGVY